MHALTDKSEPGIEKTVGGKFDPSMTARERACFEAGIKLGAIFHSLLAFPVKNEENVIKLMEEGFNASFKNQPYVADVKIRITVNTPGKNVKAHEFDYTIVKDYMIDVQLELLYDNVAVAARIEWMPDLNYPLMYVSSIR